MSASLQHDRLRAAGWEIELRTVKPSRREFSRRSYFAYRDPNGDVVYELSQALERLDRAQDASRVMSACPPQT